ncbi:autotransporter-associated beta strand repeat-containing protein [Luteolibacter sp. SL250]|uniref:beta strand repeat-containing protein n=1 Tax=Luteolibacter sp. SL250 TaxID=2995170 RepID=UPI002270586F|nr:autotransporter-associated beta strand repeat-containing protein [Luteolibacter sp. SL250]WAC21353.1 autotransporter-associated beta strand repeat-containing protein [Luteolibacter sp. SL250]
MKTRLFPAFVVACISLPGSLSAIPLYWDGSAGSAFSNAENWSTDAAGNVNPDSLIPGASDVATFNATSLVTGSLSPQIVDLGGNISVSGLNYTGQSNRLTLQGGGSNVVLSIGAGGIVASGATNTTDPPTKVFTIGSTTANQNVAISLTADQSWLSNISGTGTSTDGIFVRNGVSLGVAGAHTLTLGGSSTSTPLNTISGVISDGGADRSLSISMAPGASNGNNRWTLSGNNTYSGATTVSQGALTIGHVNALGSTSSGTVVQSGAGLFFRGDVGTMAAEALTLSGNGPDSKGALRNVNGTNTWTGAITLASGTVSIGADAGTLTLASTANISTNVASTTLQFVTTSATATSALTVNGNISGAISVNKGPGSNNSPNATVTFGTTAKTYTGSTAVTSGILALNTGLTNTSAVTVAAGATLRGNNGSINNLATTTINGRLAPGATLLPEIGSLTMGRLDFAATSTLAIDINSSTATSDLITLDGLTGNLNITEGSILTLNDLGGASLVNGALMFIKYSGVWNGQRFTYGGNLINDNDQITLNGNQFQLDYDFVNGADKGVALVVVPEPAAAGLVAFGALVLGLRRRRAAA